MTQRSGITSPTAKATIYADVVKDSLQIVYICSVALLRRDEDPEKQVHEEELDRQVHHAPPQNGARTDSKCRIAVELQCLVILHLLCVEMYYSWIPTNRTGTSANNMFDRN